MKPVKQVYKKVRARNGTDIFYTDPKWDTKEIDGVTFIAVSKEHPFVSNQVHWMKKDNMEYVK
jgi:hypothetical protein